MTTSLAARRHERAVYLWSWRRARKILRNGGRLVQEFWQTPQRCVIAHEVRLPSGESAAVVNVGELWI